MKHARTSREVIRFIIVKVALDDSVSIVATSVPVTNVRIPAVLSAARPTNALSATTASINAIIAIAILDVYARRPNAAVVRIEKKVLLQFVSSAIIPFATIAGTWLPVVHATTLVATNE